MAHRRQTYFFMAAMIFLPIVVSAQSVIYVNQAATGANNGISWTDAYIFLQDALQAAQSSDEVWVAQGTYRPDQGTGITLGDREASFVIPSGVSLYGGFSGAETARDERDWEAHETKLSGDLAGNDLGEIETTNLSRNDNSLTIVSLVDPTDNVIIDGFTISSGNLQAGSGASAISLRPHCCLGASLTIANSTISKNSSTDGTIRVLGILAISQKYLLVVNTVIEHNRAETGAAIKSVSASISIEDSIIRNNVTDGIATLNAWYGSVYISRTTFENNYAYVAGAIRISGSDSGLLSVWSSRFIGNSSRASGGAISLNGSNLVSINNVFSGNHTDFEGGALELAQYSAIFVNNVFAFNYARISGGAIATFGSRQSTTIANSIFWENEAPTHSHFDRSGSDYLGVYNTAANGGFENVLVDDGAVWDLAPSFVDPDGTDNIPGTLDDNFRLSAGSPAIDAGDNLRLPADSLDLDLDEIIAEFLSVDILNNVRIFDGGSGTATVDIGAYEFGAPPVVLAQDQVVDAIQRAGVLLGNYPNPFNPSTTISYTLPRPGDVRLEVFDLLGKRVRMLESGFKPSGQHEVTFDATGLPSGVYFYTLTAGGSSQTRKMVVVR